VANSLQTKIASGSVVVAESSSLGTHRTTVSSDRSSITRTFSQSDFIDIVGGTLPAKLTSRSVTGLSDKRISAVSVTQTVTSSLHANRQAAGQVGEDKTGFDNELTSIGQITLTAIPHTALLPDVGTPSADYVTNTLPGTAAFVIDSKSASRATLSRPEDTIATLFSGPSGSAEFHNVVAHLKANPRDRSLLHKYSKDAAAHLPLLLSLYAALGDEASLIAAALRPETAVQALISSHVVPSPSSSFVSFLISLARKSDPSVAGAATLALGTAVGRISPGPDAAKATAAACDLIHKRMATALSAGSRVWQSVAADAVANSKGVCGKRPVSASAAVSAVLNSDFPFNKSYTYSTVFGGSQISLTSNVLLFAGTNFDCRQNYFNYELQARAWADLDLFGIPFTPLNALAIYGKHNGALVGHSVSVTVFGQVVYNLDLPTVDCSVHTYPVAHTSPGYTATYTFFVYIVPVTLTAGVQLDLKLEFDWQVCDSSLLAMAQFVPSAAINFFGDVSIDVSWAKVGLRLSGSFYTELVPQAFIHGSLCSVGVDVKLQGPPFSAQLVGSYHLFSHSDSKVFWSYTHPAIDIKIYPQEWPIAP
jgi:hypothetical protein